MNIAIAQSGGPTCAINASLLGVFKEALLSSEIERIFGSINGIEGIIKGNLIDLSSALSSEENMELLKQTPATALGSCRYKLPSFEADGAVYEKIIDRFKSNGIGAFFYIGGNDSMDTVAKLSRYVREKGEDIKIIGIPKTIDNDLMHTDHTPGFGSAAKYLATTLKEIIRDSSVYDLESVTVIEIMGRHAGWLTASSCVLRAVGEEAPHLIYLPENKFSVKKFLEDIRTVMKDNKTVIVAVSEGIKLDPNETEFAKEGKVVDDFGHTALSGVGKSLEHIISSELGCKVRSIELNVLQRCSSHLSSKTDLDEAEQIGSEAVKAAIAGISGKMMAFKRISNSPYALSIEPVDAAEVANAEKFFPHKWINDAQNNVTDEAIEYFLPLIEGEPTILTEHGLPRHFHI